MGIGWSTMLRVPDAEEVPVFKVQMASLDEGVTEHDVLIAGEDDAPVLALKGLRLKAMATVDEHQRFALER